MPPMRTRPVSFGLERVRHVVLDHVSGAPAGNVEEAVVHRQVDVGDQRSDGLEALQHRRQQVGIGGLGRDLDDLFHRPFVAVAIPGPDRGREILEADDTADEAIGLGRIMCRAQFEHQLVLFAEVDLLQMLALVEVPEVQPASIFAAEQDLRNEPVLERVGRSPFAGHHRVVAEMPPEIIGELLRAPVHLPLAEHVEAFGIEQEYAARRLALGVSERVHIDSLGAAMDGVHARIPGLFGDFLRLDDPDDLRISRIRLGVDDVQPGRPQPRHDEVAPFHMRVRRIGAKAGRAGIPAEMVQFVAGIRHVDLADDARVGRGFGVDIDHGYRIGFLAVRIEGGHIGQRFLRRLGRHSR